MIELLECPVAYVNGEREPFKLELLDAAPLITKFDARSAGPDC